MPIVEGLVGNAKVETLRDVACIGVIIKQQFVREDQYTGEYGFIQFVDHNVRRVRKARVAIDTPYLSGTVEALCLKTPICDAIIGNIPGARRSRRSRCQSSFGWSGDQSSGEVGKSHCPIASSKREAVGFNRQGEFDAIAKG